MVGREGSPSGYTVRPQHHIEKVITNMGQSPWKDGKYPLGGITGNTPKLQARRAKTMKKYNKQQKRANSNGCAVAGIALLAGGAVLTGSAGYLIVQAASALVS